RAGLCVLCGLPAAGKSTLARALRRQLPQRLGWACALFSYDELIPPEAFGPSAPEEEPEAGPEEASSLLPRWKRSRRELLQCLESFLLALLTGEPLCRPVAATQPAWERFLACCRRQGLLSADGRAGAGHRTPAGTPGLLYLILDDNFYYQSMRYEVYQLARRYSLSFCQLFLECPLECCLQRNGLRSQPLPEQTICLMAGKIEVPDPKKNAWEQNSLLLPRTPRWNCLISAFHSCVCSPSEQVVSLLATALANPVKQNEENAENKEADRATCATSAVHQADQSCRRIISQAMKDAKDKKVLPREMKSLAEELNKLKAEFLAALRQGNRWEAQVCLEDQEPAPAVCVSSSFQQEAAKVVNKYLSK
ncbi:PSTK kinase, partial [Psilopogon haemacephalus]|nr:PSTK kinase [Psilopogon haemacephalus]